MGCSLLGVAFALSPVAMGGDLEQALAEVLATVGANGLDKGGAGYSCEVAPYAPEVAAAVELLSAFYHGEPNPALMTYAIDYRASRVTAFQQMVWETVRRNLPWGAVASYQDVAAMVGKPGAARAVGNAMAACRMPGFVPCQRVVGSSGSRYVLGGYGSSLELKRQLLKAEGIKLADN